MIRVIVHTRDSEIGNADGLHEIHELHYDGAFDTVNDAKRYIRERYVLPAIRGYYQASKADPTEEVDNDMIAKFVTGELDDSEDIDLCCDELDEMASYGYVFKYNYNYVGVCNQGIKRGVEYEATEFDIFSHDM